MQAGRAKWRRLKAAAVLAAVALSVTQLAVSPVRAQTPISGFSGVGGPNSKKPIDIESDRLEVDDKTHVAIFIGNVSATQGDYNLRAPRLEVTYEKAPETAPQGQGSAQLKAVKPTKVATTDASADPVSSGQIKLIHACGGKVVLTSKKDEQEVTADDAIYDVKGQKITMTGKEVILTQKQDVVKGKQLDIDLATGRATLVPEKGRVKAIFTQDTTSGVIAAGPSSGTPKKDKDPGAEARKPPSGAGAGWQAQSR
jgi:lipopolysaccharide export system protein LptA